MSQDMPLPATPLTDAKIRELTVKWGRGEYADTNALDDLVDFARDLERQLAQAVRERDEAREAAIKYAEGQIAAESALTAQSKVELPLTKEKIELLFAESRKFKEIATAHYVHLLCDQAVSAITLSATCERLAGENAKMLHELCVPTYQCSGCGNCSAEGFRGITYERAGEPTEYDMECKDCGCRHICESPREAFYDLQRRHEKEIEAAEAKLKSREKECEQLRNTLYGASDASAEEHLLRELAVWSLMDEVEALRRGLGVTHIDDPLVRLKDKYRGALDREYLIATLATIRKMRAALITDELSKDK
jgi:hypothetical protein